MIAFVVFFMIAFSFWATVRGIDAIQERDEDALTLLEDRYKHGEISVSEYVEMKQILHFYHREG